MGLKVPTIQKWCRDRRIPHLRMGREYMFRRDDIDAFEIAQTIQPGGSNGC